MSKTTAPALREAPFPLPAGLVRSLLVLVALSSILAAPACNAPPPRKGEISAWEWQREQERWGGASEAIENGDPLSAAIGVLFGYLVGPAHAASDDDEEDDERDEVHEFEDR